MPLMFSSEKAKHTPGNDVSESSESKITQGTRYKMVDGNDFDAPTDPKFRETCVDGKHHRSPLLTSATICPLAQTASNIVKQLHVHLYKQGV